MVIHGSACKTISRSMAGQYMTESRFMAVHCNTLLTGFAPEGRGGIASRFWCALENAASHAQSVAIASSHCRHKLVYSPAGTLAHRSLDMIRFASRQRVFGRLRAFGRCSRLPRAAGGCSPSGQASEATPRCSAGPQCRTNRGAASKPVDRVGTSTARQCPRTKCDASSTRVHR
jgi:hypothetical protein